MTNKKTVPIEPTTAMRKAGNRALERMPTILWDRMPSDDQLRYVDAIWRDMFNAAP